MRYGVSICARLPRQTIFVPGPARVLSVFPGRTASRMQAEVHAAEGRDYHPERLLQPEDVAATVLASLALPATAEITDLHIRPALKS